MFVRNLMKRKVACCSPGENLAQAAARMWERCCGALPVVDEDGRVIGILTDRDICIALGTRNLYASDVKVEDVKPPGVHTVAPDDEDLQALEIMAAENVRRLPVVDHGALVGVLSIDDLIRASAPYPGPDEVSEAAALYALREILRSRGPHGPSAKAA